MTPALWVCVMLVASAIIYLIAVGAYYAAERPGMALCFIGYVIANVGLVWDAVATK